jgi:acyl-CoA synthetase (AMP-forming)/AMP-acid ligase II/thioesterase domain-containing protein
MQQTLTAYGIGRQDRVAIVLPNGPEMAATFLAVATGATSAPLNPNYRAREFDFFLSDLEAKALIIQSGMPSPAISIAQQQGMQILYLTPQVTQPAGICTLQGDGGIIDTLDTEWADAEDVALVLHTSGTTSRPKIVPLTHGNLCTSAHNIRATLALQAQDRCLNVMPLFHIHGLIGATVSSLTAGASIVCTPGFHPLQFFEWLAQFQPTWYSAVPTMHQAIVARAPEYADVVRDSTLRLIRSSSAALPPQVMASLEDTFHVPVIESYGMTEASHQMASNPLPPRQRKPGSVGVPAGPDIAIMDDQGTLLPDTSIGEIVIRGANVTRGYANNPDANATAFVDGWFRTGDQGHFDAEGYLILTDRLKEIINRGGEKISPREIDEVLLDHPHVAQAVAFATPHPTLGEDVAAALVLRTPGTVTEWELQQFVAQRLADFKVPRRILIVDEIPKGPTGKLQRVKLAETFGITADTVAASRSRPPFRPPQTDTEHRLTRIWSQVLNQTPIGVDDNYFALGGDSLLAAQILTQISSELALPELPLVLFLHTPTIAQMAIFLDQRDYALPPASLVALRTTGTKPPFYCVHACSGEVLFLQDFAAHLDPDQPVYALRAQGLDVGSKPLPSVELMAAHYRQEIEAFQPQGPYYVGGAGAGGLIAYEIAQQLTAQGQPVNLVVLMDTLPPNVMGVVKPRGAPRSLEYYFRRVSFYWGKGPWMLGRIAWNLVTSQARRIGHALLRRPNPRRSVFDSVSLALWRYQPRPYAGRVVLFPSTHRPLYPHDVHMRIEGWQPYLNASFTARMVPGKHLGIFTEPHVQVLAEHVQAQLNHAQDLGHAESLL